ncbi:WXG100 family type VII secretion target [Paractinoplanes globisporus]|uniref:WXG100 family type VII secretion target n=1 Tax=Paractinoplanes globisporus TaxID=113565 RepID=A0ABW6WPY2_9ACTN|nr:WXG100 family type VII secretion target [Actinoplanes globisporus]
MNPLVVAASDGPKNAWSGVWIAEDIELIGRGVRDGNWIDGTLGVVGTGLDALAMISDPVGVLLQYGVSWLIEHVRPLSEALDWLAGDPAQIAAHAQTWRNIAADLRVDADGLARAAQWDTAEWTGAAGDAYRAWAADRAQGLGALVGASETMSAIVEGAGMLIAAVRVMVRDAVATVVSRLIVYATEELASFGLATGWVVAQVTTLVASWAAKISEWLRSLIRSLRALDGESGWLASLIEKIKEHFSRSRRPEEPSAEPPKKIGGPKEFDPQELRGLGPDEVRARIPDNWAADSSARGGGQVFRDPDNFGRQIRIMPGYPPGSRPDPITWGPYAVVSQGGKQVKIPLKGNPTL